MSTLHPSPSLQLTLGTQVLPACSLLLLHCPPQLITLLGLSCLTIDLHNSLRRDDDISLDVLLAIDIGRWELRGCLRMLDLLLLPILLELCLHLRIVVVVIDCIVDPCLLLPL